MKRLLIIFLLALVFLVACKTPQIAVQEEFDETADELEKVSDDLKAEMENLPEEPVEEPVESAPPTEDTRVLSEGPDWRTSIFTDVLTGMDHSIADFEGKIILLESFAVWCPTCTAQQKVFQEMRETEDENIVHIALDTDPHEDADTVRKHAEGHGFDWIYAVSPPDMTQDLIDEFGLKVVNAPGAPVVLICEDQSARLLGRGIKDSDEINEEIAEGC